jgi:two-component system cell cycle sensor histidine kinase/response regulator CckA
MTRRTLERAGYQVTAVEDGIAARHEIEVQGTRIDVLVTDVVMPGMSGIDLAEWMLEQNPGAGIVLLSGYTAETLDLERVLARGARFVAKPVASGEMLRAIRGARAGRVSER